MRILRSSKLLVCAALLLPCLAFGQIRNDLLLTHFLGGNIPLNQDYDRAIMGGTNYEYASTSIPTGLIMPAFFKNGFDAEQQNRLEDNLFDHNTFALQGGYDLSYIQWQNSFLGENWGIYFGYNQRILLDANFTSNVYRLAKYGNAPYRSDTFKLGSNELEYYKTRSLSLGAIRQVEWFQKNWIIKGGFNLVSGSNLIRADIDHFDLYTEEYGEYIDADYDFTMWVAEPAFISGFGASLDFGVAVQLTDKSSLSISANNLGTISWFKRNTEKLSGDRQIRVDGIYLPFEEMGNFNEETINDFLDSLENEVAPLAEKSAGNWRLAPNYQLHYASMATPNFTVFTDINYRPGLGRYPSVMGGLAWTKKGALVSFSGGMNKVGQLTAGLRVGYTHERFSAVLITNGVEGFIASSSNISAGIKAGFFF